MTTPPFDRSGYERQKNDEAAQAGHRVLQLLEERGIAPERAPLLRLDCPYGHKLDRYRLTHLSAVGESDVNLESVRGDRGTLRPTARSSDPYGAGTRVCLVPGCPALLNYEGYCDAHGGQQVETVGHLRTEWRCRLESCEWRGPVTRAHLLRVYGTALALGIDRIPVTGNPAPARRRR